MRRAAPYFFFVVLLYLVGCRAPAQEPLQWHRLTDLPAPTFERRNNARIVGIGPIELPNHLDRPQIVHRDKRGRLLIYRSELWTHSSLRENLKEAIAAEIQKDRPNVDLLYFPWYRNKSLTSQIQIQVETFEARNKTVTFAGQFEIKDPLKNVTHLKNGFRFETVTKDESISNRIDAMQSLISKLVNKISPHLFEVNKN